MSESPNKPAVAFEVDIKKNPDAPTPEHILKRFAEEKEKGLTQEELDLKLAAAEEKRKQVEAERVKKATLEIQHAREVYEEQHRLSDPALADDSLCVYVCVCARLLCQEEIEAKLFAAENKRKVFKFPFLDITSISCSSYTLGHLSISQQAEVERVLKAATEVARAKKVGERVRRQSDAAAEQTLEKSREKLDKAEKYRLAQLELEKPQSPRKNGVEGNNRKSVEQGSIDAKLAAAEEKRKQAEANRVKKAAADVARAKQVAEEQRRLSDVATTEALEKLREKQERAEKNRQALLEGDKKKDIEAE
ncbi:hypothetical protein G9A89_009516 [Geosiphon pyriformis]|nr:hypothetical protein G9A89_009516 [Geosiphon pyriformis]